jgi:hypothetical protein
MQALEDSEDSVNAAARCRCRYAAPQTPYLLPSILHHADFRRLLAVEFEVADGLEQLHELAGIGKHRRKWTVVRLLHSRIAIAGFQGGLQRLFRQSFRTACFGGETKRAGR